MNFIRMVIYIARYIIIKIIIFIQGNLYHIIVHAFLIYAEHICYMCQFILPGTLGNRLLCSFIPQNIGALRSLRI